MDVSRITDSSRPAPGRGVAWFWAMPTIAVAMFILAMAAFLFWAQRHDLEERRSGLIQDILWQEQTIRHGLQSNEEVLAVLARDLGQSGLTEAAFRNRVTFLQRNSPELIGVAWITEGRSVRWSHPAGAMDAIIGRRLAQDTEDRVFDRARLTGRAAYGAVYEVAADDSRFEVHIPVFRSGGFTGTVTGIYSVQRVLEQQVPWWYAQRYQLQVIDPRGQVVASKLGLAKLDPELQYEVLFDPPGHGLMLRATAYHSDTPLAQRWLVALVVGLSGVMVWSLWTLRNHMRRRARAEHALWLESAFRKAMEDSMVTGMRAVDMEGRITYVNQAFCRMVGLTDADLIGCRPPMPYWSPDEQARAEAAFDAMLSGNAPSVGIEHQFCRPGGELIDVVVYSSPLIDENGKQTGWMSSVNDITDRKRAREDLRRSHERFVTVLNAMEAAVSVTDAGTGELLFANGYFRNMFGVDTTEAPCCYVAPWHYAVKLDAARGSEDDASPEAAIDLELQDPASGRWYHVRANAFRWVDGRTVRMEVATDITAHTEAEEMTRRQMEKLQFTSRLVTMGEMASTLAHELNQPLSAIASYNTGCVNLLKANQYSREELIDALEKLGFQAQRAGKIIRSIREFVKRSEPRCAPILINDVVEEAAGFADIEARKRGVAVDLELAPELPQVMADRIMIQQVVHNLMRNGIEAVIHMPAERRRLTVRTLPYNGNGVEIQVADQGNGIAKELADRLFMPFYTTKEEGMGMGLNICRSIVEFHKGRLWFESNAGGGTVFRFTLPSGA